MELHSIFFHSDENEALPANCFKMSSSGLKTELPHHGSMRTLILSWPWTLLGSKFCNIFAMSSMEKLVVNKGLSVLSFKWEESLVSFLAKQYLLAKKELKSSVFKLKLVTKQTVLMVEWWD